MKLIISFALGFALAMPSLAAPGQVKFIEMQSFQELESLPPRLAAHFRLSCNQTFLSVIRQVTINPDTQKATISIGGLVEENSQHSCQQPDDTKEVTVMAGYTFSGREYEVVSIVAH